MSTNAIRPAPAISTVEDMESKKGEYAHNETAYEKEDVVVENVVDHYAAGYTDNSLEIDEAENKRLRRLINTRILPIMCVVYLTQALDKGALGPISIMEDINAQGQDYALTSTVMWVGIMVGEPIAAQLIRRLPVAKLLVGSMAIWTGLCFWLAFSMNVTHILVNRALMGFFEATFNPCLVTITVQWYKKEEQPIISAIWQSMFAFGTTVQSLVAYGMYNVRDTSLRNWQWVVLIFAILSAIGTVVSYFLLPDSPTKTRWASEDLKVKFVERVRSNNQGLANKTWKSDQAWEALKDPMVYALFLFAFLQTNVIGGLSKFNSLLINRAFGFDVLTSQLLKIPMSLCSVCFYMMMAFLIHKFNNTLYAMIGYCVINATGTIVLCAVAPSESTKVGLFIAFILMQAIAAVNTAIFLMMSRDIAGQTKKSLVYGSTFAAWGAGNATAPQLFWSDWAPRYLPSLYIHLGIYAVFIMLCLAVRVMLVRRNKAKIAAQEGTDVRNLHAFEDLTDLQNPDFRYSL